MAQTKIEQGLLKFTEATDYLKIPTGTTAQRPSSPVAGYIRFNTTISAIETYDGTGWVEIGLSPPTFSSVDYPGSATALDPAGGESLVINGTTFNVGITVTIDGTTPSSITRNSENQLTVTAPAKTAGTYNIVFTNTDGGTATAINAVSYNGIPAFTNAAGSLGSVKSGDAISFSVAATEPDGGAITYAVTSGSLPSGATLNTTTGAITGTAPSVNANTTSNFTITATDNENQSTARAYSIAITPPLPSDSFQVVTYTGDGTTSHSITGVGLQPDFVWIKNRDVTENHSIYDNSRTLGNPLYPNSTAVEGNPTNKHITSFNSDGFTLGTTNHNANGNDYVAWAFKANGGSTSSNTDGSITSTVQVNSAAGFSMVKYTGVSGGGSWGHGLTQEPEFIIFKRYTSSQNWFVFAKINGAWHYFEGLNTTAAAVNYASNMSGSSTTMTLNNIAEFNTDPSSNYLAYCFHSVDSFSKFGPYTGNGSEQLIETGFEPAFIIIKATSTTSDWRLYDNRRGSTDSSSSYVGNRKPLYANLNYAEGNGINEIRFLSNGFEVGPGNNTNTNGVSFIYMAFAADPDTTSPTLADSFNTVTYSGNSSTQSISGLGFSPNLVWIKGRNNTYVHGLYDTIRGPLQRLRSNGTNADENVANSLTSFDSDGFTLGSDIGQNQSANNYVAWSWKADDNEPTIFGSPAAAVYKFEDNANDVTGTYNGTASNVTYTSSGKFNKAAEFNGSSSYITLGSASSLVPTNFTFSAWVKTTSTSTDFIVGTNVNPYYSKVAVRSEGDGRVRCLYGNYTSNESGFYSTYNTINDGNWHHIVYFINQTTAKLYIDGSLDTTHTLTVTPTTNGNLTLGSFYNDNDNSYNTSAVWEGEIDQVRIYQGVLAQEQVTELYNETAAQNDDLTLGGPPETIISANSNAGFSIVKYEGDGVAGKQVPHGLSSAPDMIIAKSLDATYNWMVYHSAATTSLGKTAEHGHTYLNLTNVYEEPVDQNIKSIWNDTAPNASTFSISDNANINVSGDNYIAYCFHSVSNYSKFGSYTGDGTTNLSKSINIGFQPDFVLVKATSVTGTWLLWDSARVSGGDHYGLYPNTSGAETIWQNLFSIVSTGFKVARVNNNDGYDNNNNGVTYIYMAFKIN